MKNKIELLAPAGSLSKLKTAVIYGADAVYAGGKNFGLRTASDNFTIEELREGIDFAHKHGAKVYITVNSFLRGYEFETLADYAAQLEEIGADAAIVSDLGVFSVLKKAAPKLQLHISTQANCVNAYTCMAWKELGASRIVLARELTLPEIKEITSMTGGNPEIECFIHGAMCVSYSGRCLLSGYMAGRDSNRGDCAQPCRWNYRLVEEKRPGEYYPIYEDERGTFIFNSKDLCLVRRLPDLINAGVNSFKIEGRVKSEFYVATVVAAYRRAIDAYMKDPEGYTFDEDIMRELEKVSHREYYEGFLKDPSGQGQIYGSSSYIRSFEYSAFVEGYEKDKGLIRVRQRNKFSVGDKLEILTPDAGVISFSPEKLYDKDMKEISSAPNADALIYIPFDREISEYSMLRKCSGK